MYPADKKRFAACLLGMSEIYNREISQSVVSMWWEALKSWDVQAVEAAFAKHIKSPDIGQFMPKPADIVRMLVGTSADGSQIAWAKVDRAVRTVGTYSTVAFDDPLIHRVLQDMGGWIAIGMKDDEAWPFVANEFRNRYQGYRSRDEMPEYPTVMIGIAEANNNKLGHKSPPPTLIGDQAKAVQVLNGGTDRPSIGVHREIADTVRTLKLVQSKGEE
jgi:Domain of unknown function (DUF6475)